MSRTPIAAANWKMKMGLADSKKWAEDFTVGLDADGVETIVAPSPHALDALSRQFEDTDVQLSAQDMHWANKGAFTGEISPEMLTEIGCDYVIIGHSEPRTLFGETDEDVNRKVEAAFREGLKPIVCVGESLDERESDRTKKKVFFQIRAALSGISERNLNDLVIAYEPLWAIGTGESATPEQAQQVHGWIRGLLNEEYGGNIAEQVRVVYGGSVKPYNIDELYAEPDIDGALVGSASLEVDSFSAIVEAVQS